MSDNIHKTHFPVTKEMPWREKEKQAVLLLQKIIEVLNDPTLNHIDTVVECLDILHGSEESKTLVDWVMKYKGE